LRNWFSKIANLSGSGLDSCPGKRKKELMLLEQEIPAIGKKPMKQKMELEKIFE